MWHQLDASKMSEMAGPLDGQDFVVEMTNHEVFLARLMPKPSVPGARDGGTNLEIRIDERDEWSRPAELFVANASEQFVEWRLL